MLKDPGLSVYSLIDNAPSTVGLPFTYIVDANANVRYANQGMVENDYFLATLNEVLASPYSP